MNLKKDEKPQIVNLQKNNQEVSRVKYILAYQAHGKVELIRKHMVLFAQKHGNNNAAKVYECHRNTVSKWRKRFEEYGEEGLKDLPRIPQNIPHRIDNPEIIREVCRLRDETGYSAERLKHQFDLEPSNMAIHRILEDHDFIIPKKKKYKEKKDLWAIKKGYKTLKTKLQLDGKKLTDIPKYLRQKQLLDLPTWQFTLRDVKSGATYISFMTTEDGLRACTFIVYVFEHFIKHRIRVKDITIQVDGASFALNLKGLNKTMFQTLVEDIYKAKLKIVPGGKTKQSDVETFHKLIEDEFYRRQEFSSKADFYDKAYKYIYNFNFIRKNRHKDWKTPLYFLKKDKRWVSPTILDLPPIWLDAHSDLYFYKKNPKSLTLDEILILDIPPEKLPCSDYKMNETLQSFVERVSLGYLKNRAHDVPIYPNF
jgi:transposase